MAISRLTVLEGNEHVEKGVVTIKRGFRKTHKQVYRLMTESCWRYLDTSKVVKGL